MFDVGVVVSGFEFEVGSLDRLHRAWPESWVSQQPGITVVSTGLLGAPVPAVSAWLGQLIQLFPGVRVLRIERELVTQSDLGDEMYTGLCARCVRRCVGSPSFPDPFAVLSGGVRVWVWADVVEWFRAERAASMGMRGVTDRDASRLELLWRDR